VNPRGVELSGGPWAETTIYEIAEDLHNVIETLDIGPLVAVGHAAGGRYVRILATEHPEDVQGLVLLSSGGKFENKEKFDRFLDAVMRNIRGEITPKEMKQVMSTTGSFARSSDEERLKAFKRAFFCRGQRSRCLARRIVSGACRGSGPVIQDDQL